LRDDILAMVATQPFDLRGLRRSEIVSLNVHKDDTLD
tara:strand:+ start:86 stop:196 length:111 start_codon:yes stop_codon:yes gene_type:complete